MSRCRKMKWSTTGCPKNAYLGIGKGYYKNICNNPNFDNAEFISGISF